MVVGAHKSDSVGQVQNLAEGHEVKETVRLRLKNVDHYFSYSSK